MRISEQKLREIAATAQLVVSLQNTVRRAAIARDKEALGSLRTRLDKADADLVLLAGGQAQASVAVRWARSK